MIKDLYYCFWRTPLELFNSGYEKGWDGNEWQHKNDGPAVPLSKFWGSNKSRDFLLWGKPKCDLFCGQSGQSLEASYPQLLGLWAWKWHALKTLFIGNAFKTPWIGLHLWSSLGDTHPVSTQGGNVLSKALFHACWFICQTCMVPVETVVINTGFLTQHLASSGTLGWCGAHCMQQRQEGHGMGFIPASVTNLLPNPEQFVLLLFPFACLVPCGCFGEGAAARCRIEGA